MKPSVVRPFGRKLSGVQIKLCRVLCFPDVTAPDCHGVGPDRDE